MSYYFFTIHKDHVTYRRDDGHTGSMPGQAAELIVRKFCASFKIMPNEFEILDVRNVIGDFVFGPTDRLA